MLRFQEVNLCVMMYTPDQIAIASFRLHSGWAIQFCYLNHSISDLLYPSSKVIQNYYLLNKIWLI